MKLSRAMIAGGLAAGGMVLAIANPASAGDWCDDYHYDDYYYDYSENYYQDNSVYQDNDFLDIL